MNLKQTFPSRFSQLHTVSALALLSLAAPVQSQTPDAFYPQPDRPVEATAIQVDGKILVGGSFNKLGGEPRNYIGRLNADGTLDAAFNPGADGPVRCLVVQTDGKILVGGFFTTLCGQPRNYMGRLNSDGTLDSTFNAGIGGATFNYVSCLALQADGKILVGGEFITISGQPRHYLGRLNRDGTLDTTFNPGANSPVRSLALQSDGKILVGGGFTTLGGQPCSSIGRLTGDGRADTTFNATGIGLVFCLAVQADGQILVGGGFAAPDGQTAHWLCRLKSDGTRDASFAPAVTDFVFCLAVQADGKILLGGKFETVCGQPRNCIGRLKSDGTLDTTFNPGAGGYDYHVFALAIQTDGKILAGGEFTTLGGQACSRLGRLNNTGPATQSLSLEGSELTWLRGGSAPEVWRTGFEVSTNNGADWTQLGEGTRTNGGWHRTAVSVPANASVRARGFVTGGYASSSTWFVQSLIGSPVVVSQPVSRTNNAGTVATFQVLAEGTAPFGYQWRKDGVNLGTRTNIVGAQTASLTLKNVLHADEAGYSVVVSNALGSVTSLVATLSVVDPFIATQPASQNANPGAAAAFTVTAAGTAPFHYQWRKEGAAVAGATASSLSWTNVQGPDAGSYEVVVSNGLGSVTSLVALLTVNGMLPDAFNPRANGGVYATAIQPDGKILVGGSFTNLAGQARPNVGRLNSDGTSDNTFHPEPGVSSCVYCLLLQGDGKIVVGGNFTKLGGQPRANLARLNSNGSLDTTFNPGADSTVYCLALQADGKLLAGGYFLTLGGQPRSRIGRLNADGTLDATFYPEANNGVFSLAVQADGRILAGGSFTALGGQPRERIGRLNADGTLDTTFNPKANEEVYSLAEQSDGKILVGGDFTALGGQPRSRLGRLESNGTLDLSFNPGMGGSYPVVQALALQTDGKILVGGRFTSLGGQARADLGRLTREGTVDTSFNPGATNTVLMGPPDAVMSLAVQTDGKVLVGGWFTRLGGQPRERIGRLSNTEPATQSLCFDGTNLTWLRSGTSPEVWRTSFDASPDGSNWVSLGTGERSAGGWRLPGVWAPAGTTALRARGFVTGGFHNGSSWWVETNISTSAAFVLSQPLDQTNNVGTDATFVVVAGGSPTLSYQWRKDGSNIASATRSWLTLTNVQESDQGWYCVAVSNAFGSVTSSTALLVVNQPPVADAGATQPTVISANGANVRAILNGTRSYDPDGDPLRCLWFSTLNSQPSTLLASGVVASVELPVGGHSLALVVNDGRLAATNAFTLEVLTSAQVAERLIAQVNSTWPHSRPLVATLSAALASIERGNPVSAINQLLAFQSKVRAQVGPRDPALAATFIKAAQEIIEALRAGASQPGDPPRGRFTSVSHKSDGGAKVQFAAPTGPIYLVEASTDLVTWETIGLAEDQGGGTFAFADADAAKFPCRYYRIQQLTGQ